MVLAWATNPDVTTYGSTGQPSSDLDLWVFLDGNRIAYSSSMDNTQEMVEFVTPETGTYDLRVYRHRWGEGGTTWEYRTYGGLAWWSGPVPRRRFYLPLMAVGE